MQSRLYINGKEVRNPVARGIAAIIIPAILSLFLLLLALILFSVLSIGFLLAIGAAALGLGTLSVRRAILNRGTPKLREIYSEERSLLEEKKAERE